jgi:glycosyltransferase involved in cell wall biosynthesis
VEIRIGGKQHREDERFHRTTLRPLLERPGVHLLGEVGGVRKTGFLQRARALLFPIEWEEPFGLVMIEAMLCGTPVIAFPGGAVEEVIDEGVTGFVVRSVDEMAARIRTLDGFDRRSCHQRACRRWSAQRMVADHLRLYREVTRAGEIHERRAAAPDA